jgi:hypothetical protein
LSVLLRYTDSDYPFVNSGAPQGQEVPAPLVIPVCYYIYKARYRIILAIELFCRCGI